jgi:hypothetical protein
MDSARSRAPWTGLEVANLQAWQDCGWVHPYTCPQGHTLTPRVEGFVCDQCRYHQNWCWAPMLQGAPPDPRELLNG